MPLVLRHGAHGAPMLHTRREVTNQRQNRVRCTMQRSKKVANRERFRVGDRSRGRFIYQSGIDFNCPYSPRPSKPRTRSIGLRQGFFSYLAPRNPLID